MQTIDLSTSPYVEGNFSSYDEALRAANKFLPDGYAFNAILERVADSIQKVRRGEAAFERDGIAFPKDDYRFPLLAALFYIASHERRLTVLDFGGSLGSTYFQNCKLLNNLPVNWSVVEQKHFVDYGKAHVPEVNFYYSIVECAQHKNINCLLMSSSINYVDDPRKYFNDALNVDAKYLIVDRTYFNFELTTRIAIEHVPESTYKAVYPITLLNIREFESLVTQKYQPVFYMPPFDVMPLVENNVARIIPNHGWLFKHK